MPDRTIVQVPLNLIHIPEHRRAQLKPAVVELLVRSIKRRIDSGKPGLLSPIRLSPRYESNVAPNPFSEHPPDGYSLVTGLHRVGAHECLRLAKIDSIVSDDDPIDAEIDEVEENLARRDLTVLERARLEKRQKELYLKRFPETAKGVAGARAKHLQATSVSFAGAAAAQAGTSKRTIERRVQIADALGDDIVAVLAEHPIANQVTKLLELARVPEEHRRAVAQRLASGEAKSLTEARRIVCGAPKVRRPPKHKEARAPLAHVPGEGYRASVHLLGRLIEMRVAESLDRVEVVDAGTAASKPTPSCQDDGERLTVDMLLAVVRQVIAEWPPEIQNDIKVWEDVDRFRADVTVELPDRLGGFGVETVRAVLSWRAEGDGKRSGSVEWYPMQWDKTMVAQLHGLPTLVQARAGAREFLGLLLGRTHGASDPSMIVSEEVPPKRLQEQVSTTAGESNASEKLRAGLLSMGFKKAEARRAVEALGDRIDTQPLESLIKEALAILTP